MCIASLGYALVASLTLVVGLVLLTHVTRGIHISEETCEYVYGDSFMCVCMYRDTCVCR